LDIVLNRRGGLPLADQLVSQIELEILSGRFERGRKLPSVRALARQLKIHPRTVHAAYKKLKIAGNLDLTRGSGAFVSRGTEHVEDAWKTPRLEETLRFALHSALVAGYSSEQIRAAVRGWLESSPPTRLVVADTARETAEVFVEELRGLGVSLAVCNLSEAAAELKRGAIVLALPFHQGRLHRAAPGALLITATLAVGAAHREALLRVPAGGVIVVVSHSPRVVTYARTSLHSLRGHDVVIECHGLKGRRSWMRVVGMADLVLADVVAFPDVQAHSSRVRELRLLSPETLEKVQAFLSLPAPSVRA
jgi:DNA-binding transcriptional regulator YhcF (GntR family)